MRYQVNVRLNGVTSAVDSIVAPEGYSAKDYVRDCNENGDDEWNEMLSMVDEVILIANQ